MMNEDYHDRENTDIAGLIELFERCIAANEQHYFDEETLEQILEYYEIRNAAEKAETVIDYAINQNPYSSEFLIRKAEYLLNRKKYKLALEFLDKATLFDSGEVDVFLIRSDIYVEMNEIEKAIETLNTALEHADPEEKDLVYAELSDIYEMREDFTSSFECLVKALEINPASEDALHKLAHIVDMTDRFEESVELHKTILEKDPYSWLGWYNLGRAYMGLNLYERAIESFEFVMVIQEDFDLVYRDAADVYYRIENFSKAIEMFEIAQEKSGGFEDYSFRIGLCFERKEEYKASRYHYRKATRKDPYFHEAYFRIGETYRMEDRFEAALVNYKKALKYDESNEDYICTIVSIYKMLDRDDEVINYLNWLVNVRPDILSYWLDLIIYLMDVERYTEALEICGEAINRNGHFPEYFYLQSAALYYSGKEKESLSVLEHALNIDYSRHMILYEICKDFVSRPKVQDVINLFQKN